MSSLDIKSCTSEAHLINALTLDDSHEVLRVAVAAARHRLGQAWRPAAHPVGPVPDRRQQLPLPRVRRALHPSVHHRRRRPRPRDHLVQGRRRVSLGVCSFQRVLQGDKTHLPNPKIRLFLLCFTADYDLLWSENQL